MACQLCRAFLQDTMEYPPTIPWRRAPDWAALRKVLPDLVGAVERILVEVDDALPFFGAMEVQEIFRLFYQDTVLVEQVVWMRSRLFEAGAFHSKDIPHWIYKKLGTILQQIFVLHFEHTYIPLDHARQIAADRKALEDEWA